MTSTPATVPSRPNTGILSATAAVLSAGAAVAGLPLLGTAPWNLLLAIVLTVAAGALAVVDARTRLLPNRYVAPLATFAAVQVLATSFARADPWTFVIALVAALVAGATYFGLGLMKMMGFGDVKFVAAVVLFAAVPAGWLAIYVALLAVLIGALQRLVTSAVLRRRYREPIPHGPAIAAAAALVSIATAVVALGS